MAAVGRGIWHICILQILNLSQHLHHQRLNPIVDDLNRHRRYLPGLNGNETVPWNALMRVSSNTAFNVFASFDQPSFLPAIGKNTCDGSSERPL